MSNQDLKHLFQPGTGAVPPYLAGRKLEQEYFQDCVEALIGMKPPSRDMIVYGPRGNGKTSLLRHLTRETRSTHGNKLDVLWSTPKELEHPGKFVDLVVGNNSSLRRKINSASFSVNFGIAKASAEIDMSRRTLTISDLLQERCQSKPLILNIDEAHRLDPQMGEELLNASQTVRAEGGPFLLVLAGTPNLEAALGKASASFWDRSKIFRLGRLSPAEARQAITVPLKEACISFASGVAEEIVDRTHCYPFFTQVWGDCLARRLDQTGETEITMERVQEVEAEVMNEREAMYHIRFNEIKRMGLLGVAESVADAFIQCGEMYLHESTLEDAIERRMACDESITNEPIANERIIEKFEQLSHLGYVWQVKGPGGYGYEPGIPSLMSFVHGYSLPQTRGKAASPAESSDAPSL